MGETQITASRANVLDGLIYFDVSIHMAVLLIRQQY